MAAGWEVVRVFISSTFRDMHAERDYLTRIVFPELRERCATLRLHLVDVDLRWGVTEEDADRGRVLQICLEEIDRCRPFFVGILGERYGSVPRVYQVPDEPQYDWLKGFEPGYSVTALEVYYGVLRNPAMQHRAFFYFRAPAAGAALPAGAPAVFEAENAAAREKLARLKSEVRARYRVCDGYPWEFLGIDDRGQPLVGGLETFGRRVLEDLWEAVSQEFGARESAGEPLAIENRYHEEFADRSAARFVGRQELLERMTECSDGPTQVLAAVGPSGCGKSALLAAFARQYGERHPDAVVLAHFIGVSPGSSDIRRTLWRLAAEIGAAAGIGAVPEDYEELRRFFLRALASWPRGRRLLLIIDALNQLDETHRARTLDWLPAPLPANARLVLSTLEGPCLDSLRRRWPGVTEIAVGALGADEKQALVRQALGAYRKRLEEGQGRNQLAMLIAKAGSASPLYLAVACEELRLFGDFERVSERITQFPDDVESLFEQVLERAEADHGRELVAETLMLLDCSRSGLLESELLELLRKPGEVQFPRVFWARLYRTLQFYLRPPGQAGEGLLAFFHQQFMAAVRQRYFPDDVSRAQCHARLAAYFKARADPAGDGSWSGVDPRGVAELPYHVVHARDLASLRDLMQGSFLQAKAEKIGRAEALMDARLAAETFAAAGRDHWDGLLVAARAHGELAEQLRRHGAAIEGLAVQGAVAGLEAALASEPDASRRGALTLAAAALLDEAGFRESAGDFWQRGERLLPDNGLQLEISPIQLDPVTRVLLAALLSRHHPAREEPYPVIRLGEPIDRDAPRSGHGTPGNQSGSKRTTVPVGKVLLAYAVAPVTMWWCLFSSILVMLPAFLGLAALHGLAGPALGGSFDAVVTGLRNTAAAAAVLYLLAGLALLLASERTSAAARRLAPSIEDVLMAMSRAARGSSSREDARRIFARALRFAGWIQVPSGAVATIIENQWSRCRSAREAAETFREATRAGDQCEGAALSCLSRSDSSLLAGVYEELLRSAAPVNGGTVRRALWENRQRVMNYDLLIETVVREPRLRGVFGELTGQAILSTLGLEKLLDEPHLARAVLAAVARRSALPRRRRFGWAVALLEPIPKAVTAPMSPAEPVLWAVLTLPVAVFAVPAALIGLLWYAAGWVSSSAWQSEYNPELGRQVAGAADLHGRQQKLEALLPDLGRLWLSRIGLRRLRTVLVANQIAIEGAAPVAAHGRRLVERVLTALVRRNLLGRREQTILTVMGDRSLLEAAARLFARRRIGFLSRQRPAGVSESETQLRNALPILSRSVNLAASMGIASLTLAAWVVCLHRFLPTAPIFRLVTMIPAVAAMSILAIALHACWPSARFRGEYKLWTPSPGPQGWWERFVMAGVVFKLNVFVLAMPLLAGIPVLETRLRGNWSTWGRNVGAIWLDVLVLVPVMTCVTVPEAIAHWRGSGAVYPTIVTTWLRRSLAVVVIAGTGALFALLLVGFQRLQPHF